MKKTLLLSALASALLSTSAFADDSIQKQVDELKSKIEQLEKMQKAASTSSPVSELEDRIDKIETSAMMNKINWGLDSRTRVDGIEGEMADGSKYTQNNVWSNRLRLNMSSDVTDDMKFTGRMVMYKNWADDGSAYVNGGMDPMQGRRPGSSSIFVDRAYVDYTALKGSVPVTFTIGRQPSSDGPSYQFKENSVRKGTYDGLGFDGGADGVVATIGLTRTTGIPDAALRFAYGKGYQTDTSMNYLGNTTSIEDSNVYGVFLDAGLGIPGSLAQLGVVRATDVVSNVPGDNKNIGDVNLYTAMAEFSNINETGIDAFVHYAHSQAKPNGETSSWGGFPYGLLTNTPGDTSTKDGDAYWLGARYSVDAPMINNPKIGVEYNHGSQNWFSFTQGSNDTFNKLATRGSAWEAYYIQPINHYSFLRAGVLHVDNEYAGSGWQIGSPMPISSAMGSTVLDKLTNYYLLFNLTY